MVTTWHGTGDESEALNAALRRNCTCVFNVMTQQRTTTCAGHTMLLEDQRALDGLLFERQRIGRRYPHAGQRVILPTP